MPTEIDMTNNEKFELYHRLSQNNSDINDIITIDGGDTKIEDLDIELVEKIEWEPKQRGEYTFEINNHNHTVNVYNIPETIGEQNKWITNEGSETTLSDSVGRLNGSIEGPSWKEGAGTKSTYLKYNENDDRIDLGSNSRSDLNNFHKDHIGGVGFWVRPDSVSEINGIIIHRSLFTGSTVSGGFIIDESELRVVLGTENDSRDVIDISAGNISAGEWVSVAFTGDGSTGKIFINGEKVDSKSFNASTSDTSGNWAIGVGSSGTDVDNGRTMNGAIDQGWWSTIHVPDEDIKAWHDATKKYYFD